MPRLRKVFFLIPLLLLGCSGLQQSEQQNLRKNNAKGECVLRNHDEFHYSIDTPKHRMRERYPWEKAYSGKYPMITKEFFRCKGSSLNSPHIDPKDINGQTNYFDCGGAQKHSLPLRDDREYVFPILIELLNHVQEKTKSQIIITCGHRCPVHNAYVDNSPSNQHSKHLLCAEVDFYVQGKEQNPQEMIDLIMQYYKGKPQEFATFKRLEKHDSQISTQPWYNKEVLLKLYKKEEGRDFDNRHPYPYICIQARFDRERSEKVSCSWNKAFTSYKRY